MRKAEEAGDDLNMRVEANMLRHDVLTPVIEEDDDKGDEQITDARGVFGHPGCLPENILNCGRVEARRWQGSSAV
jgi:hypothetical protein